MVSGNWHFRQSAKLWTDRSSLIALLTSLSTATKLHPHVGQDQRRCFIPFPGRKEGSFASESLEINGSVRSETRGVLHEGSQECE